MEILQINKDNALKAYQKATQDGKTLLENLFTKEVLNLKITDVVKTFDDALKIVGVHPNAKFLLDYNGNEQDIIASQAHLKLSIIAKALNQGWKPDWSNSSEYKYIVWMKQNGSGSGFSFDDYDYSHSLTGVGSRLCFKSSELAVYAGKQFESIYNDLFTL